MRVAVLLAACSRQRWTGKGPRRGRRTFAEVQPDPRKEGLSELGKALLLLLWPPADP